MGGTQRRRPSLSLCGWSVSMEYARVFPSLLVLLAIFSVSPMSGAAEQKPVYHPGRHVCLQKLQRAQPVPYRQSYRRAVYRQTMQLCEGFRLCSRLTLTYQTAYRTVFHMQIRTHFAHGCCPGWQQKDQHDKSCSQPVCSEQCQHGGKCVAPDKCECSKGWTGPQCQKDVDECEGGGGHKCQQVCQNLPGSYECSCQDGFKIAPDKMSCTMCLSCVPEFRDMQTTITTLSTRVEQLETEKEQLMTNFTSMVTHYEEALGQMQASQASSQASSSLPPGGDHTGDGGGGGMRDYEDLMVAHGMMPGFDRLASLSNQISLLEERMADCTCENYVNNHPRS